MIQEYRLERGSIVLCAKTSVMQIKYEHGFRLLSETIIEILQRVRRSLVARKEVL